MEFWIIASGVLVHNAALWTLQRLKGIVAKVAINIPPESKEVPGGESYGVIQNLEEWVR